MKTTASYICLKNLRYYAYHGVAEQERVVGNEYVVCLRCKVDVDRATRTDDVADTVSYADLCEVVGREMAIPSRLLEHVCGRIARGVFERFPAVEEVEVELFKRNPPMGADIESAGLRMSFSG
ncbi:MAG: dihydroneopterin aldolase [Mediterranea sp.]|jgi:dihydroneopterin aldolase|nr:dihydroneopterin aldolase [Mediterranea sp.]